MPTLTPQHTAPPPAKVLVRRFSLLRTAAGSLGLKVGGAGLGFINSILLARLLGPTEFGVYSIVLSVVNVAAMLAVLGLPMLVTREVAANAEHGNWGRLKGVMDAAHRTMLLAVLVLLCVSAILLFGGWVKTGLPRLAALIAMALVPIIAFSQLRAAILRGLHWVVLADIPDLLVRPVVMLALLSGAFLSLIDATVVHALGIYLAAGTLAFAVGTWWLITKQPAGLKSAVPHAPENAWMLDAMPFLAINIIGALEGQVSLYLLGYLGGADQAGLFQVTSQLVGLIAMGLVAVNMPLQPNLAAAWSRGDKEHAQRLLADTARIGTGIAVLGVLLILVFAESILRLYGVEYVAGAQALRILAIGQLINAAMGSCGILLLMTGHQRIVLQGTAFGLLLSALIAYFSIPHYGVAGGAIAAAAGLAFWNIYFTAYAMNKLGLNTTIFRLRKYK